MVARSKPKVPSMAIRIAFHPLYKVLVIAIVPLAVAACASVRPTASPPAGTASFIAPVFPGDTLTTIATRYGVGVDELLALNSVKDPNRRVIGGQVRVPAYARPREMMPAQQIASPAAPAMASAPTEPAVTAPPTVLIQPRPPAIESQPLAPLPTTPRARATVNAPAPPKAPPAAASPAAMAVTPPATPETSWYDWLVPVTPPVALTVETEHHLIWPVEGRVISHFGDNPNGGRTDGINVEAPRGAPIHTVDSGEVSYVGNELKGYGNLVLIRHDNGFITAYAHADSVQVKRGQRVERGQIIGSAGDTGNVSQPQLHFELRRGTTPVDPTPYLGAPPRSSGERLAERTR